MLASTSSPLFSGVGDDIPGRAAVQPAADSDATITSAITAFFNHTFSLVSVVKTTKKCNTAVDRLNY
jgi:hypothetical protein